MCRSGVKERLLSSFQAAWLIEKATSITRMRTPGLQGRLLRPRRIFTGPLRVHTATGPVAVTVSGILLLALFGKCQ